MQEQELRELYCRRHLTLAEIGSIAGLTRQAIYAQCKKYGIKASEGERVTTICAYCGKSYELHRKRWRTHATHYCSDKCYYSARKSDYRPSKQGQRYARKIWELRHGELPKGAVIHHIDGNCSNNNINNLMLFPNHAAHIRFHHSLRIKSIK